MKAYVKIDGEYVDTELLAERLKKAALRNGQDTHCINILIEQSLAKSVRIEELMVQNDVMSDRIHLDLDPRIKRLTERNKVLAENLGRALDVNNRLAVKIDSQDAELQQDECIFEEQRAQHKLAKRRYISRLAELVTQKGELQAKLDDIHEETLI